MSVAAIIVAAGEGRRFGGSVPKTYLPLAGRPMIMRTLERCFAARSIGDIIVVVGDSELSRCEELIRSDAAFQNRSWSLQTGGPTRQQSVRRGLEKIPPETELVVIHDGARPLVSPDLIDRCVALAREKDAVIAGVRARDTIKIVGSDYRVASTPDRSSLWEIQTPQVFRREVICAAHEAARAAGIEATDDSMLVERTGQAVFVVEGDRSNIKVTLPEDILFAEVLIREGRV
jgi:2-C-methyl-D-erythritol 4-phosphate cytidylyltransferase